ncbi:MAG: sarcosine oxidase subunit alpha family protein [Pseudomonadota bacterium]
MSDQPFRLPSGGRIDRSRHLGFTFDGKRYTGHPGDTLASALLANGVHLVARSFKYHRPRGIVSAGSEEPCAFVQLGRGARTDPNVRATEIELHDGLEAASINCWPAVGFDLGAVAGLVSGLLPAGFYYKTFMWPSRMWMTYERLIRHAAGLGRVPSEKDPDRYDKRFDHYDVVVVGGGPAGLAAALAAGRARARVLVVDEHNEFGGQLLWRTAEIDGRPALDWVTRSLAELAGMPEVRLLKRATLTGYYDHNFLIALERVGDHLAAGAAAAGTPRQRLWKLRAKQVVLATGAIERPLVFANNDLPGVMLAGAAQTYVARYAVRPGARALVFTNNDSAYEAAAALADAGIEIAAIVEARPGPPAAAAARARSIEVLAAHVVVEAEGRLRVAAAAVAPFDGGGLAGEARWIDCDLLCVSGGWSPAVHLHSQSGAKPEFNPLEACFIPGRSVQNERSGGAAAGAFALAACLAQGSAAGTAAAREAGFGDGTPAPVPSPPEAPMAPLLALWEIPSASDRQRGKKFVDLQNDVTAADIALAAREGYRSVEHTKRYTTTGMGVDQGKTSNLNALAILAGEVASPIPELGTTTFRPPYTPIAIGALAGRDVDDLYDPWRRTPMTDWHVGAGAVFESVGRWRRPLYYPRSGEDMDRAVRRECLAVRQAVGLADASTLGKIDVQGPDAVKLLDWVTTNAFGSLVVGGCRYGLMLREDGMVFDDGVVSRLGEHRYLMTTTSGNAEAVVSWLEEWLQCEGPHLEVYLTSATVQWASAMLAGPLARSVLATAGTDLDLDAFPHMTVREGKVAGLPARVFRVSFTGESTYEINVPANCGLALWEALMAAGAEAGMAPIGTEALHVLRAEKGYIVVGHDTDGTVTPFDLGMGWIMSKNKADFIGKRSLARADTARAGRKQLVGLLTEDPRAVVPEGSQILDAPAAGAVAPAPAIGHVTSSYMSPTLDRSIALALIVDGRRRMGNSVAVARAGGALHARITAPRFYDPEGKRLDG